MVAVAQSSGATAPWESSGNSDINSEIPVFAIMGMTGAGKSTFISKAINNTPTSNLNRLSSEVMETLDKLPGMEGGLDRIPEVSDKLESCTREVETFPCILNNGRALALVDTPGFGDSHKSDDDIMCQIVEYHSAANKAGTPIAGIIYLHDITEKRMTASAHASLDVLMDLCGVEGANRVIFVTTKWDDLKHSKVGEDRPIDLQDNYWKPFLELKSIHCKHDGDWASAEAILTLLAERANGPINRNGVPDQEAAGWAMVRKLERRIKAEGARRARLSQMLEKKPQAQSIKMSLERCRTDIAEMKVRKQDLEKYGYKMEWKKTLGEVTGTAMVVASLATLGIGLIPALVGGAAIFGALDVALPEGEGELGAMDAWKRKKVKKMKRSTPGKGRKR